MAAGENGRLTRGQSKRRPTTTDRTTTTCHFKSFAESCAESFEVMCGVMLSHLWNNLKSFVESFEVICGVILSHLWSHFKQFVESFKVICGIM